MKRIAVVLALCLSAVVSEAVAKPKLVVQIVVGGLRYDFLDRFGANMGPAGFRRFSDEGVVMADSRYDFMQTLTPAGLATITTGADPCTHGVVSERWADNTTGKRVYLIADPEAEGLDSDAGIGKFSNHNLIAPTLGDQLKMEDPKSRVVTVAFDPISSVVMGGFTEQVYWLDATRFNWISSSKYMSALPEWVVAYNKGRNASEYLGRDWTLAGPAARYRNTSFTAVEMEENDRNRRNQSGFDLKKEIDRDFERILYTPAANTLLVEFVKQAIVGNALGRDEHCDLLNVCFDTPRYVLERYGSSSVKFEDMLLRLDENIADMIGFIFSQVKWEDVVIVLTGDHGTCDEQTLPGREADRFDPAMFRMLLSGYLSAQYGAGDWVVDYVDRQIYLDRNMIYTNKLNPAEVQDKAVTFALQFRGISDAVGGLAMQKGYSGGPGEKMRNSFYPKRGGDLTINLMPGWIENVEGKVSLSGSMYGYDTHVPMMFIGGGLKPLNVDRSVDMKDLAPTLARIMEIDPPAAAMGRPIDEVVYGF